MTAGVGERVFSCLRGMSCTDAVERGSEVTHSSISNIYLFVFL